MNAKCGDPTSLDINDHFRPENTVIINELENLMITH